MLPLQFNPGDSVTSLGLSGRELFDLAGIDDSITPHKRISVRGMREDGRTVEFSGTARLDTPAEVDVFRNGGILPKVVRDMISTPEAR